ncbi:glycine zipper 2TM domain-containing protein [Sphingomonas sp. A2-49]|uniref:glycine zipper 2TM domain-containing protein n=1 Tax=Sphingomonas sp. A2-49 TaxID=1391375 RepID=UPI0021CFFEEA|nr:glycine zipper 2TM domain-containing protein [Sphingomonas sp. A2-49]MCU6452907.1 glycine zipper 2TM domain-containing protein [Sphingomonas sp. A2-49]
MFKSMMSAAALGGMLLAAVPAVAQSAADEARFTAAQQRFDAELARYRAEFDRYRAMRGNGGPGGYRQAPVPNGYDPRGGDPRYDDRGDDRYENGYDAARDYRTGSNYRERVLSPDERVYAGNDGRYYCKRGDGTTGLIVGGAAGGILGNVIDGGHSRIVGTLLGGAVGAIAGRSVDQSQSQVRCR